MNVDYVAFTHAGSYYKENQDAILINGVATQEPDYFSSGRLDTQAPRKAPSVRVAVADGVSGLPAAAAASKTLCEQMARIDQRRLRLPPPEMAEELRDALSAEARRDKSKLNGGAALVTAELYDDFIRLWHAGDCRGYLFQPGSGVLTQLTRDHTLRDELMLVEQAMGKKTDALAIDRDLGLFANSVENLFVLSPYSDAPKPTTCLPTVNKGDILLLCSDGLFENLSNEKLECIMQTGDLETGVRGLLKAVLSFPKSDNISVIALQRRS